MEIDFCPQCRGVWLDRGELDKIIDAIRSRHGIAGRRDEGRSSPGFSAHDDRQRSKHHGYKRRRSFLSDLFDLNHADESPYEWPGQGESVFTQENETILHASPTKVWSALTRFEDYGHWNPFIRISGSLALDAIVKYSFRMKKSKRGFFIINARISVLEHQRHISLSLWL
ncbi:zf-TFIIB domain-containing protein [Parasphingorhabdus sp.]|uniref:zf-TFIIB domain-containing protein n=1 Tax=Parasphingorhabdus sp. TaxID=2709688 RepID=UPI003D2A3916